MMEIICSSAKVQAKKFENIMDTCIGPVTCSKGINFEVTLEFQSCGDFTEYWDRIKSLESYMAAKLLEFNERIEL